MAKKEFWLPESELKILARLFLPDILAFFESEEGKKGFEEWEKGQKKNAEQSLDKSA